VAAPKLRPRNWAKPAVSAPNCWQLPPRAVVGWAVTMAPETITASTATKIFRLMRASSNMPTILTRLTDEMIVSPAIDEHKIPSRPKLQRGFRLVLFSAIS
jgi:hypothetical protein